METFQQTEDLQSTELNTCVECETPHDNENLFVLDLRELAKIKGEEDGPNKAFITPGEVKDFAICANCCFPEEKYYTLASAIASAERYRARRSNIGQQFFSRVTEAEAKQLVSCFSCEEMGKKKTLIQLCKALAPGWVGCNILKGRRLGEENMQNPHKNPRLYVDSKELLKPGKDGFALCHDCAKVVVPVLQKLGRKLGVPEHIVIKKIRSQPLIYMLQGVRAKENR